MLLSAAWAQQKETLELEYWPIYHIINDSKLLWRRGHRAETPSLGSSEPVSGGRDAVAQQGVGSQVEGGGGLSQNPAIQPVSMVASNAASRTVLNNAWVKSVLLHKSCFLSSVSHRDYQSPSGKRLMLNWNIRT